MTLFHRAQEILKQLPEGVDSVPVLRPLFEAERAKNSLLDAIIKGETTCAKQVEPLVKRAEALSPHVPSPAVSVPQLAALIELGAYGILGRYWVRTYAWQERADPCRLDVGLSAFGVTLIPAILSYRGVSVSFDDPGDVLALVLWFVAVASLFLGVFTILRLSHPRGMIQKIQEAAKVGMTNAIEFDALVRKIYRLA